MSPRPVVLLVDDEPRILSALKRSLRREGYDLVSAGSSEAALAILDERRVDLVVSDQKMPGTNGLELLGEVARRHPGVARVLLTGWPEEVAAERLAALDIRVLLPKPWDDAELKATLRRQLAGGPGTA